MTAAVPRC